MTTGIAGTPEQELQWNFRWTAIVYLCFYVLFLKVTIASDVDLHLSQIFCGSILALHLLRICFYENIAVLRWTSVLVLASFFGLYGYWKILDSRLSAVLFLLALIVLHLIKVKHILRILFLSGLFLMTLWEPLSFLLLRNYITGGCEGVILLFCMYQCCASLWASKRARDADDIDRNASYVTKMFARFDHLYMWGICVLWIFVAVVLRWGWSLSPAGKMTSIRLTYIAWRFYFPLLLLSGEFFVFVMSSAKNQQGTLWAEGPEFTADALPRGKMPVSSSEELKAVSFREMRTVDTGRFILACLAFFAVLYVSHNKRSLSDYCLLAATFIYAIAVLGVCTFRLSRYSDQGRNLFSGRIILLLLLVGHLVLAGNLAGLGIEKRYFLMGAFLILSILLLKIGLREIKDFYMYLCAITALNSLYFWGNTTFMAGYWALILLHIREARSFYRCARNPDQYPASGFIVGIYEYMQSYCTTLSFYARQLYTSLHIGRLIFIFLLELMAVDFLFGSSAFFLFASSALGVEIFWQEGFLYAIYQGQRSLRKR